ncbi:helix-turn-helix domain-containing protein [Stenoxybacter acetivorans]|uniref:helix-turn-helix domain-containing protein n=1 Tax=Stenoxybacter acetivorans TaxID=422441 RepID=UPI00055F6192|nr:helix-turn-helix domain-containing protein [Stenoxybacter acetivorans]
MTSRNNLPRSKKNKPETDDSLNRDAALETESTESVAESIDAEKLPENDSAEQTDNTETVSDSPNADADTEAVINSNDTVSESDSAENDSVETTTEETGTDTKAESVSGKTTEEKTASEEMNKSVSEAITEPEAVEAEAIAETETIRVAETVDPALALGELLRQARENRFYSLGEIADNLKFSVRRIDALERGDYTGLPEPVFVKGFVRTYARFVGVNDTQVHHYLAQIFPEEKTTPPVSATESKPAKKNYLNYQGDPVKKSIPKWVLGLFLLLAIIAVIYVWQSKSKQKNTETAAAAVSASVPVVETNNVSVIPMEDANTASAASGQTAVAVTASESNLNGAAISDIAAASAATPPIQTLLINLRHTSWLKVDDAKGETLYSQIAEAGVSLRFDGAAPYQIRIGNPNGVSMMLNGKEIPVADSGKPVTLTVGETAQ